MVELVVMGSVALDTVKTPFGSVKDALGGAAVYSSVAASVFTEVGILGVVGNDFPETHVEMLRQRGINVDGLETREGKTFRWDGYYEYDMNQAHTKETQLNVFADFKPKIPQKYMDADYLFLANIDPELQLETLRKINPSFAAMDTMNYWIETKKDDLLKVMENVDMMMINDAEARQLMKTHNLIKAARGILDIGPMAVVIKKGEHGALLFTKNEHFSAAAYPLEDVADPTGAGDSFAGGLMGYLANTKDTSVINLRKAVVYGSAIASYNAEGFSLVKLKKITNEDVEKMYLDITKIISF